MAMVQFNSQQQSKTVTCKLQLCNISSYKNTLSLQRKWDIVYKTDMFHAIWIVQLHEIENFVYIYIGTIKYRLCRNINIYICVADVVRYLDSGIDISKKVAALFLADAISIKN